MKAQAQAHVRLRPGRRRLQVRQPRRLLVPRPGQHRRLRTAAGSPTPTKFPDGMANLGSYIHALGEKFGMYLTPGIPVAAYNQNTPIEGTSYHARDIVSNTSSYETNYNFGSGRCTTSTTPRTRPPRRRSSNSWAEPARRRTASTTSRSTGSVPTTATPGRRRRPALVAGAATRPAAPSTWSCPTRSTCNDAASWQQYSNGWRIDGDVECYCGRRSLLSR